MYLRPSLLKLINTENKKKIGKKMKITQEEIVLRKSKKKMKRKGAMYARRYDKDVKHQKYAAR